MRCVVLGLRNAVRCEIWCYGDMVIWPALQARAFALVIFNLAMVRRRLSSSFVVVVRLTQKIRPIVHAPAGARACCLWKFWICKCNLDLRFGFANAMSGNFRIYI